MKQYYYTKHEGLKTIIGIIEDNVLTAMYFCDDDWDGHTGWVRMDDFMTGFL